MHLKNEVFYNKAQVPKSPLSSVNNRDMSIAVLRAFISKRKQEHEAMLYMRTKAAQKVSENGISEPVMEDGAHAFLLKECDEVSSEEPCSTTEECDAVGESIDISYGKVHRYAREIEGIGQVVALDNDKDRALPYVVKAAYIVTIGPHFVSGQLLFLWRHAVRGPVSRARIRGLAPPEMRKEQSTNEEGRSLIVQQDHNSKQGDLGKDLQKLLLWQDPSNKVVKLPVQKWSLILRMPRVYMLTHPKEFDAVDHDPYGSPSLFLDATVQSVVDGGMLMCTATDMAMLSGETGRYGSIPLRGKYCHEMALRILLASIEFCKCNEKHSSKAFICISVHWNNIVKYLPGYGPIVPQECNHCEKKFNMGGPIWPAPIHDQEWVTCILVDVKFMKERLSYIWKSSSSTRTEIRYVHGCYLGYNAMLGKKLQVKNRPVKAQPATDQPGSVILAKESVFQANFAQAVSSLSKAQAKKVARFLPNPERH
ncbi:putative tRNA (guanine(26)-N(2))-dimethyltransferase 1 [Glycine max]|nr:putative tRNA (guanine(26)-N(2))-dimethyltransferase 1 [Glycine max]